MNEPKIDGLARHLGAQDRRRSLQALAVGLAAAAATPLVARGKKKNAEQVQEAGRVLSQRLR